MSLERFTKKEKRKEKPNGDMNKATNETSVFFITESNYLFKKKRNKERTKERESRERERERGG